MREDLENIDKAENKVETLRMAGTERYFINMLMPSRFSNLKHISYFDKGPESPGDLRVLLDHCGKTLETLTVLSGHNVTNLSERSIFCPRLLGIPTKYPLYADLCSFPGF
jgi:hypothetical protein